MDAMGRFNRRSPAWLNSRWVLVALLSAVALMIWGTLRRGQSWGDDFAGYIMQAQSLLSGSIPEFLASNSFTIRESPITLGPVAYPWGTPLLLSGILAFKGFDIQALKGLNIACFFSFLVVIWFGLKKYFSPGWGLLYFSLFAFNPFLISSLNDITSDLPFLLFSTVCVVLIRHVVLEQKSLLSRTVDLILVGLAIAISTTIRINGVLFLGVILVTLVVQNYRQRALEPKSRGGIHCLADAFPPHKRALFFQLLPFISFITFSAVWMALFPGSVSYSLAEFGRLKLLTFLYHIHYYFYIPVEFFSPLDQSWLLFVLFVIFTAWGFLRLAVQDLDFTLYCLLTTLLYLVWPPLQGLRFFSPLLPLLLYFFIGGIQRYTSEIHENLGNLLRLGMSIFVTGVVIVFIAFLSSDALQNLKQGRILATGPYTKDAQEALTFISNNTNESDIIVFFKPRAMHLYTHRPSVNATFPKAFEMGDYLLVDISLPQDWNPVSPEQAQILAAEGKLDLVLQNEIYRLYAIKH
jgi:hypothetical protein